MIARSLPAPVALTLAVLGFLFVCICVITVIGYCKVGSRVDYDFTDTFAVTLKKSKGEKLGLGVHYSVGGRILRVESISPGCAEKWNRTCLSEQKIQVGDLVLDVNGIRGDSSAMLKTLRHEESL